MKKKTASTAKSMASLLKRHPMSFAMNNFEHSMDEDRYIAIGMVGDLLFVVFTERGENIRLIFARLAAEKDWKSTPATRLHLSSEAKTEYCHP